MLVLVLVLALEAVGVKLAEEDERIPARCADNDRRWPITREEDEEEEEDGVVLVVVTCGERSADDGRFGVFALGDTIEAAEAAAVVTTGSL